MTKYPFQLLPEKEADKDDYGSKIHQRLAETLLKTIKSAQDSLSIAIEGKYGIGKSTVIKLVEESINNKGSSFEIKLFKFDTWMHEGDPLRRVFLAELVNFLSGDDKKQSREIKAKYAYNGKTISKSISKKPTWIGIIFALSVLMIPVAVGISRQINIYYVLINFLSNIHWFDKLVICLLSGPLLVISVRFVYLLAAIKNPFDPSNYAFFNDTMETVVETETKGGDKNSLEFERSLWEILNPAFNHTKFKLIIVIDNLDRLNNEDGILLFSLLQSILNQSKNTADKNAAMANRIFTVLPIDNDGFKKSIRNRNDNIYHIKNKLINIRFTLPDSIYEDWKRVSRDLIESSFKEWNEEEVEDIVRIYQRGITSPDHSFTHRELIIYINQVGILRNHFVNDEISTEILAYYVFYKFLKRLDNESLRTQLLKNQFPARNETSFLNSSNAKGELAAIIYDTNIEKASILLIGPDLSRHLYDRNRDEIKRLFENHKINFEQVFYNRIKEANSDYLIQYADVIFEVFKGQNEIDLEPYKKELAKIFYNGRYDKNLVWENDYSNLIAAINNSVDREINDFWESFVQKEFFDKLYDQEKDGYDRRHREAVHQITLIYNKLDKRFVNRPVKVRPDYTTFIKLAMIDYESEDGISNVLDLEDSMLKYFQDEMVRISKLDLIEEVFNQNIFWLGVYLIKNDLYDTLSFDKSKVDTVLIEFIEYKVSSVYKDPSSDGIYVDSLLIFIIQRELKGLQNDLILKSEKYLNNSKLTASHVDYSIIMMLLKPNYYLNELPNNEDNWVRKFWENSFDRKKVEKATSLISTYELGIHLLTFYTDHNVRISYELLKKLIETKSQHILTSDSSLLIRFITKLNARDHHLSLVYIQNLSSDSTIVKDAKENLEIFLEKHLDNKDFNYDDKVISMIEDMIMDY